MKKLEKALFDCYRQLYKEATPSADFDELMDNAPMEDGKKRIDYMAYSLDRKRYEEIVNEYEKKRAYERSLLCRYSLYSYTYI